MDHNLIPFGIGLIVIVGLLVKTNNIEEGFANLIGSMGSMPKNKKSAESGLPLFLNFYPKRFGQDFNLFEFIQKLKFSNETVPRGPFTVDGVGQQNRKLMVSRTNISPVIIIPGLGATPIYAMWNKDSVESVKTVDDSGNFEKSDAWSCRQVQENFIKLWYPDHETELSTYCWEDNIRVYPSENGGIKNTDGVRTAIDGFGTLNFGTVYEPLLEALKAVGYNEGENLFGAGYDFRKISDIEELNAWCMSLTNLIERTSSIYNQPVVLLGHDLGSQVTNYFLVNCLQEWKNKYIKSFITVSGTFGGCPKALRTVLSGPSQISANAIRNFGGLSLMMPCKEIYGDNPLVSINQVTYTSYDIETLLSNVSTETAQIYKDSETIRNQMMKAPGVSVYVMAGDSVNTESSYNYKMSLMNNPSKNYPVYQLELPSSQKFSYPDYYIGDGTMPRFALEYPIFWARMQKEPIYYQFFVNAEHSKIFAMESPIKYILGVLEIKN